jgi:hypothetical protein
MSQLQSFYPSLGESYTPNYVAASRIYNFVKNNPTNTINPIDKLIREIISEFIVSEQSINTTVISKQSVLDRNKLRVEIPIPIDFKYTKGSMDNTLKIISATIAYPDGITKIIYDTDNLISSVNYLRYLGFLGINMDFSKYKTETYKSINIEFSINALSSSIKTYSINYAFSHIFFNTLL